MELEQMRLIPLFYCYCCRCTMYRTEIWAINLWFIWHWYGRALNVIWIHMTTHAFTYIKCEFNVRFFLYTLVYISVCLIFSNINISVYVFCFLSKSLITCVLLLLLLLLFILDFSALCVCIHFIDFFLIHAFI